MKKFLAFALITCSGFASAQRYTCEVDMVDIRTQRIIQTFSTPGVTDCFEAKKECAKERRMSGRLNTADCLEYSNRRPIPGPTNPGSYNPGPSNPGPYNPGPYIPNRSDAQRYLNNGERVIYRDAYATVVGIGFNGNVTVRMNDYFSNTISNINRDAIAVTTGCNMGLCTSDKVINISTATYVKVVGLSTDDRFVTESMDYFNNISSKIDRSKLAQTEGCLAVRYSQICTGNQVITYSNRYMTVVGIQTDGRVVLKSNDYLNSLTVNVDPMTLTVTR